MTRTELLLIQLSEECAEIQQQISKALRFGLDKTRPNGIETNGESIVREITDLIGIVDILVEDHSLQFNDYAAIERKKEKVENYLKVSKELGILN